MRLSKVPKSHSPTAKNASFIAGEYDSPPPKIVIDTYIFLVIR